MNAQRWLGRLARTSWDELRTRGAQGAAKRWDRLRYALPPGPTRPPATDGVAPGSGRFFFAPAEVVELIAWLRQRDPEQARRIVEHAGRIAEHRFDLLGFEGLDYGAEVEWHLDPVHGKRAPRRPWYRIRFLDFEQVGDHKIIWELSRQQWLLTLAKAYWLTGQERFVTRLVALWQLWQRDNPYPIGVNWASSLEVAFRSLSWLWVRHLLAGCRAVPQDFWTHLTRALALNGRHIERYLSTYFAPNTHLLGEGLALFFTGVLCPQLPAARRWRARGWEIVLREAARQVQADGMHFEQSLYYHVYALDMCLHARVLAARNETEIPAAFDATIVRMLEALRDLSQAGVPPRLGDDDGGRLFDPRRNRAEHMTDPLATGAVVYGRPDFKAAVRFMPEETLWLLGTPGAARFDELLPQARPATSVRLHASGIHVMSEARRQLFIDSGPLGAFSGGHGHADALSVQLVVDGRMWLIDPGTYCYVSADGERNAFRRTAAHNTIAVDGASQARPAGPFSWERLPQVRAESWFTSETLDYFAGSHDGYRPLTHRRSVVGLKARFWVVRDVVEGRGSHEIASYWHLAPGFQRHAPVAGGMILSDGSARLAILASGPVGWRLRMEMAEWSPAYGHKEPVPALHGAVRAPLPVEIFTLIVPLASESDEVGTIDRLAEGAWCYRAAGGSHYLFWTEPAGALQVEGWTTDASFAYCGLREDGPPAVVLYRGTFLARHGVDLYRAPLAETSAR
jgi:hypothetical protein